MAGVSKPTYWLVAFVWDTSVTVLFVAAAGLIIWGKYDNV